MAETSCSRYSELANLTKTEQGQFSDRSCTQMKKVIYWYTCRLLCLTAFLGKEANLLMYLQEPPRGDGASSSVNFLSSLLVWRCPTAAQSCFLLSNLCCCCCCFCCFLVVVLVDVLVVHNDEHGKHWMIDKIYIKAQIKRISSFHFCFAIFSFFGKCSPIRYFSHIV